LAQPLQGAFLDLVAPPWNQSFETTTLHQDITQNPKGKKKRKEVFEFEQQTLTSGHHELAPCQAYHRREASEDHCSLATTEVVD